MPRGGVETQRAWLFAAHAHRYFQLAKLFSSAKEATGLPSIAGRASLHTRFSVAGCPAPHCLEVLLSIRCAHYAGSKLCVVGLKCFRVPFL